MKTTNQEQNVVKKTKRLQQIATTAILTVGLPAIAFAEDGGTEINLVTAAVTGVAVIGGIVAAGALKAVPTYAAWGVRKALSMLR